MQLDPRVVVAGGQTHAGERAGKAGGGADLGEGFVFGAALRAVEGVGAVGSRVPEMRRLPRQPMPKRVGSSEVSKHKFDGAAGAQAAALEGADGFEAAENADGAVVHAGVGDGVDVRAGGDGGQIGLGADPAEEGVADSVFADDEAFGFGEALEPCAGAEIVGREDDAGDGGAFGGRLDGGEGGERVELVDQARGVDLNLRCGAMLSGSALLPPALDRAMRLTILRMVRQRVASCRRQPSGWRFQSL